MIFIGFCQLPETEQNTNKDLKKNLSSSVVTKNNGRYPFISMTEVSL